MAMADLNYLFERLQSYGASAIDQTISASDTMSSHAASSGKAEQIRDESIGNISSTPDP